MTTASLISVIAPSRRYAGLVWPLSMAQLVSWGSIYYSFTLFLEPMETELGLARTELTQALTMGLLVSGICAVPVGALVDKGYARLVMTLASLLGGALLVAWSQVETGAQFTAIWIGLGVVLAATLYEPAFAVLVRSLGDLGKHGIASMTVIGGLASTAFIPLTYLLIDELGWRAALIALALFNFALAAPIHFFVLRGEAPTRREAGPSPPDQSMLRLTMRLPAFWWLALAFTASIFTISAVTFHVVPMLSERGYALGLTVSAVALFGPAQVASRLLVTFLSRWLNLMMMGSLALGLPIFALLLLLHGPATFWTIALFAICLGLGNGILTILKAVSVAELFGQAGFGAINGAITIPVSTARALAPAVVATIWAASGGYDVPLWFLSSVSLLAFTAFICGVFSTRRTAE